MNDKATGIEIIEKSRVSLAGDSVLKDAKVGDTVELTIKARLWRDEVDDEVDDAMAPEGSEGTRRQEFVVISCDGCSAEEEDGEETETETVTPDRKRCSCGCGLDAKGCCKTCGKDPAKCDCSVRKNLSLSGGATRVGK